MRWSPQGAHLFLQIRTRVLNNDLAADFARWNPGFTHHSGPAELAAEGSTTGARTVGLPRFWSVSNLTHTSSRVAHLDRISFRAEKCLRRVGC